MICPKQINKNYCNYSARKVLFIPKYGIWHHCSFCVVLMWILNCQMRHISIKQLVKEQLESKIVSSQVFIATTVDSKYPMSLLICAELNYTDVIPDKKKFSIARSNSQPSRSSCSVHEKWHQSQNRSCHVWEMSGSARLNSKDSKSPTRADHYGNTTRSTSKSIKKV